MNREVRWVPTGAWLDAWDMICPIAHVFGLTPDPHDRPRSTEVHNLQAPNIAVQRFDDAPCAQDPSTPNDDEEYAHDDP